MAYFPHAYCKMLLGSAATPVLDGDGEADATPVVGTTLTTGLTAGQIGIVNSDTNIVQDTTVTPVYANCRQFYLAQGSFYQNDKLGPHHGGYQETVKTKGINPKYVSKMYSTISSNALNEIVTVEFADDCTDIACETSYYLRVDAKGSPALRHLTHNAYVNAPGYSGCCVGTDNIDPAVVGLEWADYINDHAPINPFVQATVLRDVNYSDQVGATATAAAAADITLSGAVPHAIGDRIEVDLATDPIATAGNVEGYTFTATTVTANHIFTVGMTLSGTNIITGTKIIRLVSGDGGTGSVFEVDTFNPVQSTGNVTGTATATFYADNAGGVTLSLEAAADLTSASGTAVTTVMNITAATAIKIWRALDSATYVPATGANADVNRVKVELTSAYVDTQFGDCSFDPKDHFEKQPVEIFASVVDESGDPCNVSCLTVTETQAAQQGKGFGETVLRDMIQFKRYRQEDFKTDPRLREVLGETVLDDIGRTTKYSCLYILHSVPRKANPSGMMDNDQYLVKVAFPDAQYSDASVGTLKTWIEALCADAGNPVTFEALA